MSEQNSLQKIEKYNENKVVRVSQELYQLERYAGGCQPWATACCLPSARV